MLSALSHALAHDYVGFVSRVVLLGSVLLLLSVSPQFSVSIVAYWFCCCSSRSAKLRLRRPVSCGVTAMAPLAEVSKGRRRFRGLGVQGFRVGV